jgi:predicted RNA-binding protein with PIN domain
VRVLVVDGANVVGSRPDGWWRDRAGAAQRLFERLLSTDLPHERVVLVLEGAARQGVAAGESVRVRAVHAPASGDDAIVDTVLAACREGLGVTVTVVTADRALQDRVRTAGAEVTGPSWLLDRLAPTPAEGGPD